MQYISPLANVHSHDRLTIGGKAANLSELLSAGLPVPSGFIVLTSAYEQFVAENRLQTEIERLAHTLSLTEPKTAEQAALAIQELFEQGTNPLKNSPTGCTKKKAESHLSGAANARQFGSTS